MRRQSFLASLAVVAAGACTARVAAPSPAAPPSPSPLTNEALRPASPLAANLTRDVWPARYREAPAPVREAYDYAIGHHDTLQWIPCYCGCRAGSGHADNFD